MTGEMIVSQTFVEKKKKESLTWNWKMQCFCSGCLKLATWCVFCIAAFSLFGRCAHPGLFIYFHFTGCLDFFFFLIFLYLFICFCVMFLAEWLWPHYLYLIFNIASYYLMGFREVTYLGRATTVQCFCMLLFILFYTLS